MNNHLLAKLNTLLYETDLLLACSELDTDLLETYGQRRLEIFAHLQNYEEHGERGETQSLREVLFRIQAQDQMLLEQLEKYRRIWREELSNVARAHQTIKDSAPSFTGRLLERHV